MPKRCPDCTSYRKCHKRGLTENEVGGDTSTDRVSSAYMAFKPLTVKGDDSFDIQDLPWGNVYVKKSTDYEDPRIIHCIKKYDSGLMVVTYVYKAYLNVGENGYTDLLEAVQAWSVQKVFGTALLCVLNKRGKPSVGLDEDQPKTTWYHSEGTYTQVAKEPITKTLERERVNPLLAGRGVQGTTPASEDATSLSQASDVPVEASTKGKKAR